MSCHFNAVPREGDRHFAAVVHFCRAKRDAERRLLRKWKREDFARGVEEMLARTARAHYVKRPSGRVYGVTLLSARDNPRTVPLRKRYADTAAWRLARDRAHGMSHFLAIADVSLWIPIFPFASWESRRA